MTCRRCPTPACPRKCCRWCSELNGLFGRVRQAFAAQQQFVADAAHELRSPLTALKLQAQALRRSADEGGREAAIARLNDGIERAIALVSQLLVLAREESEHGAARTQRVDLQDLARLAVGDVLPQAQARRHRPGPGDLAAPPGSRASPRPLQVLLRNLLDNAVKYSPDGGRVDISLDLQDGSPCITVEDSGPGIPEAERERVFDRFYRVAGSATTGSGLGLAIVKTIAQRHGASVRLDRSQRLGGLRVEVRFPPVPHQAGDASG